MVLKKPDDNGMDTDIGAVLEELKALSDTDADPDAPFSDETKKALGFLAGIMEEAEREFKNGTVVIDPDGLAKMRRAALFFKRLAERGEGKIVKIDLEPHVYQSCVRFSTDGLVLSGADLADFADLVETLGVLEITPGLDGGVDIDLSVKGLWKKAEEAK